MVKVIRYEVSNKLFRAKMQERSFVHMDALKMSILASLVLAWKGELSDDLVLLSLLKIVSKFMIHLLSYE